MRASAALALAAALIIPQAAAAEITNAAKQATKRAIKAETVAKGLAHPWGLAFLPDGQLLVTERPGRMRIIGKNGRLSAPLDGVPAVAARGQGGVRRLTPTPHFSSSPLSS